MTKHAMRAFVVAIFIGVLANRTAAEEKPLKNTLLELGQT